MICYVRGVGDNYDRLFREFFHHCLYMKSSSSLYKEDVNNKVRTPSSTNVQSPRTCCVKAPHI